MDELQQRETKEVITPGGHKLILKTYITGRESREIKSIYLNQMQLKQTVQGQEMNGITGNLTIDAEDRAYQLVVVSLDDSNIDIVNRILDFPDTETEFIKNIVNEITDARLDATKKKV